MIKIRYKVLPLQELLMNNTNKQRKKSITKSTAGKISLRNKDHTNLAIELNNQLKSVQLMSNK